MLQADHARHPGTMVLLSGLEVSCESPTTLALVNTNILQTCLHVVINRVGTTGIQCVINTAL